MRRYDRTGTRDRYLPAARQAHQLHPVTEARRVAERVEYPVVEGVGEAGLTSLVTSGAARDIVLPPPLPLPPGQHQVNRHFACEFIPVRATLFCVRSCTLVCTG